MSLIAAVEGGGTSFKLVVCRAHDGSVVKRFEADSSGDDPSACLAQCCAFLKKHQPIAALGIATFGPVGVKAEDRSTYGRILPSSPKAAWRNVDLLTPLREACGGASCACLMDTDVNAPAYAEYVAAQEKETPNITSCAYITVGTGVGVGLVVNGRTVHGMMHPEGGHVPVPPLPNDTFGGYSWGRRDGSSCPFQGRNTVEGLSSSVALTERWQHQHGLTSSDRNVLKNLPDDSELWDHAANALATACTTLLLTLSIEKIVLGGGVMRRQCLLEKIRKRTAEQLNGYLALGGGHRSDEDALRTIITTSQHGDDAGLVGAIVLARRALEESSSTQAKLTAKQEEAGDDSDDVIKKNKQEAFKVGLLHGFLIGIVATALVVKYGFLGVRKRRC